jgi:methylglutaconyl-CoA hydratase
MTTNPPLGDLGTVTYQLDQDGIARITLNRPHAANARNQLMREELSRIYDIIADDEDVRVVILTGAGNRYFCAGMDLKEASAQESTLERRERLRSARDIEMLAALPQPTIAAINGYALGGGCEMALACDLRVMAEEAIIGLTEVAHGLMPGGGGTQRLPRLVGYARAAELIYLGRRLSGSEAAAMGLVNDVVPWCELDAKAVDLAHQIATQPARALRAVKEAMRAGLEVPLSVGIDRELDGLLFLLSDREDQARPDPEPVNTHGHIVST